MNQLIITCLISIIILVLSIVCYCTSSSANEPTVEQFKTMLSKEECGELAKDRCFYLRNTSEWVNCVEETMNYC